MRFGPRCAVPPPSRRTIESSASYKVVYAAWHQGLFTSTEATPEQLRSDRNLYHLCRPCWSTASKGRTGVTESGGAGSSHRP